MNRLRHQLTLFLPEAASQLVEQVRAVVDPVQAALIPPHVTLVRDDELNQVSSESFTGRLDRPVDLTTSLELTFGGPSPSVDHGILMPCTSELTEFQSLRCRLFRELQSKPMKAHITLAHPRNPRAVGNTPQNLQPLANGLTIRFRQLALIQQTDGQPWVTLKTVNLCQKQGA